LVLRWVGDFLILAILALSGLYLKNNIGLVLEILAVAYLLWVLLKINGAVGLALAMIGAGQKDYAAIAQRAKREALPFFWNALKTGVVLFFGQILLVCPCFLFLNNFIFSPFLYVYENIKGKPAKKRSKELTAGFGWVILNRTTVILFAGYIFLAATVYIFLSRQVWSAVLLTAVIGLYLALVQSNFIRLIYEQTMEMQEQQTYSTSGKYKFITSFSIFVLVLVYISLHLGN
jgi:hypothetical protein